MTRVLEVRDGEGWHFLGFASDRRRAVERLPELAVEFRVSLADVRARRVWRWVA